MNPRIYKKRSKRTVQLLISHGDNTAYDQPTEAGYAADIIDWQAMKRLKAVNPARYGMWQRISGIPEHHYYSMDEWDGHDACVGWTRWYESEVLLPADFFDGPEWEEGGKPWPKMGAKHRMQMWRTTQIAKGWRWRGGKAIKITNSASGRAQRTNNNGGRNG